MKERKTFSCASATAALSTNAEEAGDGLANARWVFAAVLGAFLLFAGFCDAQIQVNAYIPDAAVTSFGDTPAFNQGRVFVLDTATNQAVGSPIPVGFLPAGVSVTPDGRYAYITNNASDTISVIDTVSRAVVATINVPAGPIGVATSPDAKQVYATSPGLIPDNRGFEGNAVSIVNTATNTLAGAITAGTGAIGVAFTPDGAHVYVANNSSSSVSLINTATKSVALSIPVGDSPIGVAISPNGQYVYVANQNNNGNGASPGTLSVISTATNSVALSIPVGNSPTGVAVSPNGQYVYVTNMNNGNGGPGTVSVINTATNTVVSTITVGISPLGISVTPDGKYVYVANSNINNGGNGPLVGIVSVISTATNTED